jgi:hypothetical protein
MKALRILKRFAVLGLAVLATYLTYRFLIGRITSPGLYTPWILLLWLFTAYVVLPRIHRKLVKVYLPDYFIGRTRTGDGLLGDPVNLAIIGTKRQLVRAMKQAGWHEADELNAASSWKMTISTVLKRSYPTAPVSSLYLFGEQQALAFQQEVDGNTHQRHHVRFWPTPKGWWLPGGYRADWLGAATYDRSVGFSAFTLQFTHKIEEDIDIERDYVISTLREAKTTKKVETVEHYASGFRSRNGGGDHIRTDGNLPFIHLS